MSQATLSQTPYLNSNLFSGYYLEERIDDLDEWECDDEAQQVFEELQKLYDLERGLVESYKEDELLDSWIDEVLDILGFGTLSETTLPDGGGYNDRLLFESAGKRREAAFEKKDNRSQEMYGLASALLEAKQWNADFTKRFNENRSYRDASHQIKYYLERTPEEVQWGVLTDGRKWRLYGTKDYETETFYEVDLPEILEAGDLEQFKYFYLFFRPAAFREVAGTTFLDKVWNESETAAQELGEDLQDNVFTALRVLGKGFVETNDLDIDPDDDVRLEELKEQSLVLLYRLMFILYAESRHLINPDDPDRQQEYEENFSLDQLRHDILDTAGETGSPKTFDNSYSEFSTSMWSRLQNLFSLIDSGEESLGIPPYNGGLFDDGQHEFLADNEVADRYLAEVIYRLSTTETDEGFVPADYADLDTRHLGTIYEGLLEHEFRIAPTHYAAVSEDGGQVWKDATEVSVAEAVETVDEGGLYVVNDDGERKATGAYYTPDYVVTYIVEETVDPLIEDIDDTLDEAGFERGTQEYVFRFADEVLSLKVLDPAMGSGHFLTKATGYLAEQVMERVREVEEAAGVFDEQDIRRRVSRECIYGVDLNGMAVELAKLSMWLETLAADQPLAFLDHHLKAGNSLVGSDITEVLTDDTEENGGQLTLTQSFARVRQHTLEHVMELFRDLLAIDNETLEDIKSMEELYGEIREDPLYHRLFELANVHTAEQFGLEVPSGVYETMAGAIEDGDEWDEIAEESWFAEAQAMASREQFFHWELEFPEVFFGDEGELADDAGFDSVVGNPPYVRIQELNQSSEQLKNYLICEYDTAQGKFDLYIPFIERGLDVAASRGISCYIVPNKFMKASYGRALRKDLSSGEKLEWIVDFGDYQVFDGLSTYTSIISCSQRCLPRARYSEADSEFLADIETTHLEYADLSESPWNIAVGDEADLLDSLLSDYLSLSEISDEIYQGVITGGDDHFILELVSESETHYTVQRRDNKKTYKMEKEVVKTFSKGSDVRRHHFQNDDKLLLYPYDSDGDKSSVIEEDVISSSYPDTYAYLCEYREELSSRGSESMEYPTWYSLWCPRSEWKFDSPKIVTPVIAESGRFVFDESGMYFNGSGGGGGGAYGIIFGDAEHTGRSLSAVLNSSVADFVIQHISSQFQGGFYAYNRQYIEKIPIPSVESELCEFNKQLKDDTILNNVVLDNESPQRLLDVLVSESESDRTTLCQLNLSLLDYLGNYSDGETLGEIGFQQPAQGSADSILHETTEDKTKLGITEVEFERENPNSLTVHVGVRYKPDNPEEYETDKNNYHYVDPQPAFRITDLTETEADLIEAFVPVAVDEAGGFANFRTNATKTNSPLDRLEKLTLPAVDDVQKVLEQYLETKARADELEAKIERTDDLIDEIVYELYGLTEEEIAIVEESVED
ncbi:Eco57I restriction-modification methylase domain-containing protein [Haloferax sp. S1W]|uniref:Eco57I restriction-modification methylase domain-containing protein n=1 Tax=Haloferax sp. S1W TaxID=3377110 RepID=UPI0037CBF6D7